MLHDEISFVKLLDKTYYNRSHSQIKYKILFTDFFGKLTNLLSLLWLADGIVNFQNSFVRRTFSK